MICSLIRFCFYFILDFLLSQLLQPYSHREKYVPLLENPYGSPSMCLKLCGMSEATLHAEGDVGEL